MATPYLVRKISLNNSECECEHCENQATNNGAGAKTQKTTGPTTCRLSCSSWCSVCEAQLNKEFGGQEKNRKDSQNTPENVKQEFTPLAASRRNSLERKSSKPQQQQQQQEDDSKNLRDRYIRHVETLRGRLQVLRDNFPSQLPVQTPESKKSVISGSSPSTCKLIPAASTKSEPLPKEQGEVKSLKDKSKTKLTPDKRVRRPSQEVEPAVLSSGVPGAGHKRPRDGSPTEKEAVQTLVGPDPTHREEVTTKTPEPIGSSHLSGDNKKVDQLAAEKEAKEKTSEKDKEKEKSSEKVEKEKTSDKEKATEKEKVKTTEKEKATEKEKTEKEKTTDKEKAEKAEKTAEKQKAAVEKEKEKLSEKATEKEEPKVKSSSPSAAVAVKETYEKVTINDAASSEDDGPQHPLIRPSLFSHVPPYFKFADHDVKGRPFPPTVQKLMKWKMTSITPVVVRKVVLNTGFKLTRNQYRDLADALNDPASESLTDWVGTWGRHMKACMFKTMKESQKLNHFPGTFQIGRKDRLWRSLHGHMQKFGKREFGFIPRTYILPQDAKALKVAWDKQGGKSKWIVKPPASARGSGIKVVNRWSQLPKRSPLLVQKYISNPYLINGSKFDLRLYLVVTSVNPLVLYLYKNGLVRFASVKYSDDPSSLGDRYMHLTNYSINRQSLNYTPNDDVNATQGHKWTVTTLWSYLEGTVDVEEIQRSIKDVIVKTVISGESVIQERTLNNLPNRYNGYELFGIDVLLDENLKPWLLEVNISPSLHSTSPLDLAVKGPMVQSILNLAGFHIPDRIPDEHKDEVASELGLEGSELCFDPRIYSMGLSPEERDKHDRFTNMDRDEYMSTILEDLTPDDVRHLIRYEDELTQVGNFEKIFPTPETYKYHQFFEEARYYNRLFDAWETRQAEDRSKGIKRLQKLCRKQIHLDLTNSEDRRNMEILEDTPIVPEGKVPEPVVPPVKAPVPVVKVPPEPKVHRVQETVPVPVKKVTKVSANKPEEEDKEREKNKEKEKVAYTAAYSNTTSRSNNKDKEKEDCGTQKPVVTPSPSSIFECLKAPWKVITKCV